MKNFDYIFIVLVYRNFTDLNDFVKSVKKNFKNFKIVVVNSFFDIESDKQINNKCINLECDFISVENRGYGYGNNKGIEYALNKYEFKYLIISNPDITIDYNHLDISEKDQIVVPLIKTLNKKSQNPYWVIENKFSEYLIYYGNKHDTKIISLVGIVINKLIREIFLLLFKLSSFKRVPVFAAHGSFIIFNAKIIKLLHPIYDENMFLFSEEALLAHRLKQMKIKTILTKEISVIHKEDGSISLSNIKVNNEEKKSIIYYYEKIKHWEKEK